MLVAGFAKFANDIYTVLEQRGRFEGALATEFRIIGCVGQGYPEAGIPPDQDVFRMIALRAPNGLYALYKQGQTGGHDVGYSLDPLTLSKKFGDALDGYKNYTLTISEARAALQAYEEKYPQKPGFKIPHGDDYARGIVHYNSQPVFYN